MMKSRYSMALLTVLLASTAPFAASADDKPDADGWISLFNGKDLTGWKASDDGNWKVV
ncbi:MAG: DUF1080 domain-containing protein, partial [Planctomycetes bacterium]|nr:DUF1080 domain-containing protein [Planctomycetota bacterium]